MEVQLFSNNIFHENVKQETPVIMLKYEIMLVRSLLVQADTELSPKRSCRYCLNLPPGQTGLRLRAMDMRSLLFFCLIKRRKFVSALFSCRRRITYGYLYGYFRYSTFQSRRMT